jgi:hypothetical protein
VIFKGVAEDIKANFSRSKKMFQKGLNTHKNLFDYLISQQQVDPGVENHGRKNLKRILLAMIFDSGVL